jgi:hypothetical protein
LAVEKHVQLLQLFCHEELQSWPTCCACSPAYTGWQVYVAIALDDIPAHCIHAIHADHQLRPAEGVGALEGYF